VHSVSESADQLPTDVAALQALLVAARAERDAAIAERDQVLTQNTTCSTCCINWSACSLAHLLQFARVVVA